MLAPLNPYRQQKIIERFLSLICRRYVFHCVQVSAHQAYLLLRHASGLGADGAAVGAVEPPADASREVSCNVAKAAMQGRRGTEFKDTNLSHPLRSRSCPQLSPVRERCQSSARLLRLAFGEASRTAIIGGRFREQTNRRRSQVRELAASSVPRLTRRHRRHGPPFAPKRPPNGRVSSDNIPA